MTVELTENRGPPVRRATPADAEELVRLRAVMFEAVGPLPTSREWADRAVDHFRRELAGDALVGAVVGAPDGGLASCGVIRFQRWIPSPGNPTGWAAYISSMCTDHPYRRQGHARRVLARLLDEAFARGIERIELHAAPDGVELYRSVGFVERTGGTEMQFRR